MLVGLAYALEQASHHLRPEQANCMSDHSSPIHGTGVDKDGILTSSANGVVLQPP
jgi:hypothetical protein